MSGRLLCALLVVAALAGCGVAGHGPARRRGAKPAVVRTALVLHGHPQAVDPLAGETGASGAPTGTGAAGAATATAAASGGGSSAGDATGGAGAASLPQPTALSQIESELAASGISANPNQATLTGGLALPPVNAPAAVQKVINAGNEIARLPYIWGGGHERYEDTGYDCSGSLSFVLAAAGLLNQTETSGQLESYGEPGPGKWITIFANAGHTFAYIAGLRFDTVALAETGSRWSNRSADESNLSSFVIRHPAGL